MKTVIFLSCQGGVGKTQIICSLSSLLADLGRKVAVIDLCSSLLDVGLKTEYPNIPVYDITGYPGKLSFYVDKIAAEGTEFSFINGSYVYYSGISIDKIFIVTTPLRMSLLKTEKLVRRLKKTITDRSVIGVVLNKVGENKSYEYSSFIVEKILGLPITQQVPYDPCVIKSEQLAVPLPKFKEKSAALLPLLKLLNHISGIPIPVNIFKKHSKLHFSLKNNFISKISSVM